MRGSDETLRGRMVIASDGLVIGMIAALFFDTDGRPVEQVLPGPSRSAPAMRQPPPKRLAVETVRLAVRHARLAIRHGSTRATVTRVVHGGRRRLARVRMRPDKRGSSLGRPATDLERTAGAAQPLHGELRKEL
jgi:hypothetical protein